MAPFPYFGGKRRLAAKIWELLGDVDSYVEPFFGSGAVLLARPGGPGKVETANDLDGMVANFWRAVATDPDAVAHHADWPVNECDLHARHAWLVGQRESLTARLCGDPDFYDAKAAGWWCWGACAWIGSGWCSGDGPWVVVDGELVRAGDAGRGINRQLPHLGDAGRGINRQLPHLGDAGQGINRQLPHLGDAGQGDRSAFIRDWMTALSARLRNVRVACGDWTRVIKSDSVLFGGSGSSGVLLDPPYAGGHTLSVWTGVEVAVREWAIAAGERANVRVVLCGYDDADMPTTWARHYITGGGGYGAREKAAREVLWASPSCLRPSGGRPARDTNTQMALELDTSGGGAGRDDNPRGHVERRRS